MKKRLLSGLFLAGILIGNLAGCGNNPSSTTSSSEETSLSSPSSYSSYEVPSSSSEAASSSSLEETYSVKVADSNYYTSKVTFADQEDKSQLVTVEINITGEDKGFLNFECNQVNITLSDDNTEARALGTFTMPKANVTIGVNLGDYYQIYNEKQVYFPDLQFDGELIEALSGTYLGGKEYVKEHTVHQKDYETQLSVPEFGESSNFYIGQNKVDLVTNYNVDEGIYEFKFTFIMPKEDSYVNIIETVEPSESSGYEISYHNDANVKVLGLEEGKKYDNLSFLVWKKLDVTMTSVKYKKASDTEYTDITLDMYPNEDYFLYFEPKALTEDVEIKIEYEATGYRNISYDNPEAVAKIRTRKGAAIGDKVLVIFTKNKNAEYEDDIVTVFTASGVEVDHSMSWDEAFYFTMPKEDVHIRFNLKKKYKLTFKEDPIILNPRFINFETNEVITEAAFGTKFVVNLEFAVDGFSVVGFRVNGGEILSSTSIREGYSGGFNVLDEDICIEVVYANWYGINFEENELCIYTTFSRVGLVGETASIYVQPVSGYCVEKVFIKEFPDLEITQDGPELDHYKFTFPYGECTISSIIKPAVSKNVIVKNDIDSSVGDGFGIYRTLSEEDYERDFPEGHDFYVNEKLTIYFEPKDNSHKFLLEITYDDGTNRILEIYPFDNQQECFKGWDFISEHTVKIRIYTEESERLNYTYQIPVGVNVKFFINYREANFGDPVYSFNTISIEVPDEEISYKGEYSVQVFSEDGTDLAIKYNNSMNGGTYVNGENFRIVLVKNNPVSLIFEFEDGLDESIFNEGYFVGDDFTYFNLDEKVFCGAYFYRFYIDVAVYKKAWMKITVGDKELNFDAEDTYFTYNVTCLVDGDIHVLFGLYDE